MAAQARSAPKMRTATLTTREDTLTTLERPRRPIEEMEQRRAQEAKIEDTQKRNAEVFSSTQRALWRWNATACGCTCGC